MKKILFFAGTLCLFVSCNLDEKLTEEIVDMHPKTMSFTYNGENKSYELDGGKNALGTFTISTINGDSVEMTIAVPELKTASYTQASNPKALLFFTCGNIQFSSYDSAVYRIDATYDKETNVLSGTFWANFVEISSLGTDTTKAEVSAGKFEIWMPYE